MKHLNNHQLVAVALRTDGNSPSRYQPTRKQVGPEDGNIHQMCFIPVTSKFTMSQELPVLNMFLKPRNPEHMPQFKSDVVAGWSYTDLILKGIDMHTAQYIFDTWFDQLGLNWNKKIVPLTFNWPLTREWLRSWLSEKQMTSYFAYDYRDILATIMYNNDWCYAHAENYRFQIPSLSYTARTLNVEYNPRHRDAAEDANVMIKCYDNIMMKFLH